MIGFGSIGKGTLPLIERHFDFDKSRFVGHRSRRQGPQAARRARHPLHPPGGDARRTTASCSTPLLTDGGGQGFCVNLSVDTSSLDIMELCREIGALYIDTVIEPWAGFYFDTKLGPEARSNYALRETMLDAQARAQARRHDRGLLLRRQSRHGVLVRQAGAAQPRGAIIGAQGRRSRRRREDWARLAKTLGVKGIHIAERDTQRAKQPKPLDVFVNTWSVEGFVSEGLQPAELGWGTHEKWMPENGRTHKTGCQAAIYLLQPGANTRVRSWTPTARAQYGFLVTHNESISIADYFTVRDGRQGRSTGRPATTPITPATTPCCRCTRCSARPASARPSIHILDEHEIVDGIDELGVLLYGHARTPTGTARSSRSRRRASSRPTRTPPACR